MSATASKRASKQPQIGTKRQPFGLFPAESPTLFVPNPDMWLVHEASKPEAVAKRAGLSKRIFEHWCKEHKVRAPLLADWLYGGECPEGGESILTEDMRKFRAQTQVQRLAAASKRPLKDLWVAARRRHEDYVTTDTIHTWRRQFRARYPEQCWMDGWLLRGEEPPPGIVVVKPDEIRRCALAWDYVGLCRAVGL